MEFGDKLYAKAMKSQCDSAIYFTVTSAMMKANNLDIADFQILKGSVGEEDLLGDVIIPNKEEAYANMQEYNEQASRYSAKAANKSYTKETRGAGLIQITGSTQKTFLEDVYNSLDNKTSVIEVSQKKELLNYINVYETVDAKCI